MEVMEAYLWLYLSPINLLQMTCTPSGEKIPTTRPNMDAKNYTGRDIMNKKRLTDGVSE